jgi:thiol:disulfide interchange protein DsbD
MAVHLLTLIALLAAALLGPGSAGASVQVPESAYGEGAVDESNPRIEARLLIDAEAVRAGQPIQAGVLFDLDRSWHIYWRNPGQSGLATELEWTVPGAEVGPTLWPAPEVFSESDGFITTYGYDGQVLLMNNLTFGPSVRGERSVAVQADFLVCKVRCIPGKVALERTISVGEVTRSADSETHALFERYGSRVPVSLDGLDIEVEALYSQSAIRPDDEFRAAIVVLPCERKGCSAYSVGASDPAHAFVPDRVESVKLAVTGSRPHPFTDGGFLITLDGQATPDDPGADQRLRGVLAVRGPGRDVIHVDVDLPLPRARTGTEVVMINNPWLEPITRTGAGDGMPLWRAIVLALLGGVILNLMPCVLPVLAIKVCGVAELAHQSRRIVTANGLMYTAGIVSSMVVLAAIVLILREAGTAVGWGFQFQEPLFIAAISAVLLVFALNLFGVFEITVDATTMSRVGEKAVGSRRSFFEGLLATVVATPCSAPFLGTAVGFAFASSTLVILSIFVAIGLGLAAPYLVVTWVPGWARIIPRPGPWMLQLRRVLGFALLGTVVWLSWVMGRSTGVDGLVTLLGFLFVIAFITWVFGSLQAARYVRMARALAVILGGLAVTGLVALPIDREPAGASAETTEGRAWEAFDPSAIQAELAGGRPVFVYFTADWCLTCKANEHFVIGDARVQAELDQLDVATFKADWTHRDERIRAELARFGRAGVPMYLLYSPKNPSRPEVLPELLTVDVVVEALRQAARGGRKRT